MCGTRSQVLLKLPSANGVLPPHGIRRRGHAGGGGAACGAGHRASHSLPTSAGAASASPAPRRSLLGRLAPPTTSPTRSPPSPGARRPGLPRPAPRRARASSPRPRRGARRPPARRDAALAAQASDLAADLAAAVGAPPPPTSSPASPAPSPPAPSSSTSTRYVRPLPQPHSLLSPRNPCATVCEDMDAGGEVRCSGGWSIRVSEQYFTSIWRCKRY